VAWSAKLARASPSTTVLSMMATFTTWLVTPSAKFTVCVSVLYCEPATAVPPVADAVPGYEAMQWYGLLAPAGVPGAVVDKLNAEALVALRSKEMKDRLAADGAEPLASTPAEFGAFIRRELDKWSKVVAAAKIEKQ